MARSLNITSATDDGPVGRAGDITATLSIEGMDTSFIKYFREHGMTPILMHTLETKRGWTGDMITRLIQNCNKAWGLSHAAPQELRYWDEMDTDEELNPLPKGGKRGRDDEDSEDSWDPDASIDTIAAGRKPGKKPRKDRCPSKQPYHEKRKRKEEFHRCILNYRDRTDALHYG